MSVGINSRNIDDLHPAVARGCRELIRRMNAAGYPYVGISSTYRDNEHQDWLFGQGRPNEVPHGRTGSIVTNARGGQSIHNYRMAFDFFRNISSQAFADTAPAERIFWDTAGRIWTEMGGTWGGSWASFTDRSHCEFTGRLSLSNLQAGKSLPQDAKMPWESATEEEVKEMRYNTLSEIAKAHDWASPTIKKLIEKGHLRGNDGNGNGLDLSLDMIRIFVLNDRAGLYD